MSERLSAVANYYSRKLADHGMTPKGVDWNDEAGQIVRFEQLMKIFDRDDAFSVNDLGCGFGAFWDVLSARHPRASYCGLDVSKDMVAAAEARLPPHPQRRFEVGSVPTTPADFGIASGIFNVRLDCGDTEWVGHFHETLETLDATSTAGFAFNCLTSYSDPDRVRADLYYANPLEVFDMCKRRYSRNVALLHDYDLFEFTILVRKL